jgi:threonine 3-dehydrogenase
MWHTPTVAANTMSALRKLAPEAGLTRVDSEPVPTLGSNDVLVAVKYAGICGTDRHLYEWDEWAQSRMTPPITVGHEFMGHVVEVGSGVSRISVGMRVSGEGHIGCGTCQPCRTGRAHICENVKVIGIDRDGTFAQYLVLPQENVWPLADSIPDKVAAIMDPLGNAMHTVMSTDVTGRDVLITGAGVIGLMAVAIAKRAGAAQVIVADVLPEHLEQARELGADHLLRADDEDWWRQARSVTRANQGPERWLEMSGAQSALRDGFKALSSGGTAVLLGLPSGPLQLDVADGIIFKGATVLGISGRRMYETWFQMEAFLANGGLVVESLITHVLSMSDFARGFELLQRGEATKVLLEMS